MLSISVSDQSNGPIEGTLRLRADSPPPQGLTQAQCESYNKEGYLILPDAIPASQLTELLEETYDTLKRITQGGKGIARHDASGGGVEKTPSPIGRLLATFEPGQSIQIFLVCTLKAQNS